MNDMLIRVGWVLVVLAGGVALARGLLLMTYIELTPQAQVKAEQGLLLLWVASVALVLAAVVAARRWWTPSWSLAGLTVAGPIGLMAEGLGWIPLVALVVSGPLLLVGLVGAMASERRISEPR